jgi:hypothetical protein
MTKVLLPSWEGSVLNAAMWLRKHYNIPEYEVIEDKFCEYFGCEIYTIMMDPPYEKYPGKSYAVFDEKDATLFVLRWS